MNIGIIGSGNMGSGLGRIWAAKGHRIIFSFSRNEAKLHELAASVPNSTSGAPDEAVSGSDVILLAVRWSVVKDALKAAGSLAGKILIDCTNPLTPDINDLEIGFKTSAAEEIERLAPGAKIVKAFNTVFAEVYHNTSRLFGSRMASMFYCGHDAEVKSVVMQLIRETGFEPIDVGDLKMARYLEPLAMLMINLGYSRGMGTNIALSLLRR